MKPPSWWKRWTSSWEHEPSSLVECVAYNVQNHPDQLTVSFLNDKGIETASLTYNDVWKQSEKIAFGLIQKGLDRGDRAILCFAPEGEYFFINFWACLRAGIIAVPIYPPDPSKLEQGLAKFELIRAKCDATLCMLDDKLEKLRMVTQLMYTWPPGIKEWWNTQQALFHTINLQTRTPYVHDRPDPKDLCFLQFTSGSTSDPKGVMIGHDNLWHNINELNVPINIRGRSLLQLNPNDGFTTISWLPYYHDLGLIYAHLAPMTNHQENVVHMSPLTFLKNPTLWLDMVVKYNAKEIVAPDFGYRLVTKRIQSKHWQGDLNSLQIIVSCAERIRPTTYDAFLDVLRNCNLNPNKILVPAYGLAESCVFVSATVISPSIQYPFRLARKRPDLVCVGNDFLVTIKIVDTQTLDEVPHGIEGEIWVSSKSVARGYWQDPEKTAEAFGISLRKDDGLRYLRTGDSGFIEIDEKTGDRGLYITARIKDMIIVGGRNVYPEDIETVVNDTVPNEIRSGCVAAFSLDNEDEFVAVVFEIRRDQEHKAQAVVATVKSAVAKGANVSLDRIVAIKERTIPKTTSGKIRRRSTRDSLRYGQLQVVFDSNPTCGDLSINKDLCSPDAAAGPSTPVWSSFTSVFGCGYPDVSNSIHDDAAPVDFEPPTTLPESITTNSPITATVATPTRPGLKLDRKSWRQSIDDVVHAEGGDGAAAEDLAAAVFGDEDHHETTAHIREALTISNTPTEAVQHVYAKRTLLKTVQDIVGKIDNMEKGELLANSGLTSQDILRLQAEVDEKLGIHLDFERVASCDIDALAADAVSEGHISNIDIEDVESCYEFVATTKPKSPHGSSLIQLSELVSIIIIVSLVAAALIPAYHFGQKVQWKAKTVNDVSGIYVRRRSNAPWTHIKLKSSQIFIYGLLAPLCIPIFMTALSLITILCKWLVVGKRTQTTLTVGSFEYFRWWFMDRLYDQWEFWVGEYIKDTVLINLFYKACGGNVSLGARIDTFLREVDLIHVDYGASISGVVYARAFERDEENTLILRFTPTTISGRVEKSAVVCPGVTIENGAVLDYLRVALPGTTHTQEPDANSDLVIYKPSASFEIAKLMSLVPLLYCPFLTSSAFVAWSLRRLDWFDWTFRYRPLLWWILSYFTGLIVLLCTTIILKRLLIGKIYPGYRPSSSMHHISAWIVDYSWLRIATRLSGILYQGNGLFMNFILKALGASVAASARFVSVDSVLASQADLLFVGARAQLSLCDIDCFDQVSKTYERVRIGKDAEVGLDARLEAGTEIEDGGAVVGHQTIAFGIIEAGTAKLRNATVLISSSRQKRATLQGFYNVALGISMFTSRAILLVLLAFVALIPSYELAIKVFYGSFDFYKDPVYLTGITNNGNKWKHPVNRNLAILLIGPIALVAFICLSIVYRIWQFLVLNDFMYLAGERSPWFFEHHHSYQHMMQHAVLKFVMPLVRGSPWANIVLRFWGADCHSTALVNNTHFYEPTLLKLDAGCVVDVGVKHLGHVFIQGQLEFALNHISAYAILHPEVITWASDQVPTGCVMHSRAQLAVTAGQDIEAQSPRSRPKPGCHLVGCPARPSVKWNEDSVLASQSSGRVQRACTI